ncbi:hypothetical protein [Salipiger sp. PrR002]|uniref:hypothetical protein n=1 Tax=Salipiger sp. PrR002 TaxID=2706489 RepID=UPI0013B88DE2|nr:hypothetical protein [Salipiger sp. PrR002]NDV99724.1 hypothetical protein [Salipiger sp. PrR002]NDW56678.1 hypothetical protein [Salipiger sp. PrR004]
MERIWALAAIAALLAGCGATSDSEDDDCIRDNPLQECETTDDDSTETPDDVDATVASFSFAEDMSSVTVRINGLDTTPLEAVYERNDRITDVLDMDDYVAFSIQEDPLDRFFLALGGMSADGSVSAAAVGDGGQFNKVFQDGYYSRDGDFDPPDFDDATNPEQGQVSYAGDYAAVTNLITKAGVDLQPVGTLPEGYEDLDVPGQPLPITGVIFLNVNFADAALNGQIMNRSLIDIRGYGGATEAGKSGITDVILTEGTIDADGVFSGTAEDPDEGGMGSFAGIFGGEDAAYVAGTTDLTWSLTAPFGDGDETYDMEEVGMFVLTQCGKSGAREDICALVNP